MSVIPVTVASVALWDPPQLSLTIQGVSGSRVVSGRRPVGSRVPLAGAHWYQRVFEEQESVVLNTESPAGSMSEEEAALALAPNLRSVYLTPITFAGDLVGILALGEMRAPEREPLDEDKQRRCREVLKEFMAASAPVWEARRLHSKLLAASSLLRVGPRMLEALSYEEVLAALASELAYWLGTPDRGVLYHLDPQAGARVVGRWPDPEGFTAEDERQILAAIVRRSGDGPWPLGLIDVADDPLDPLHPSVQPDAPMMRLDLPLQSDSELLGVACFYFPEALRLGTWEFEIFGHWGQMGALGMRIVSAAHARSLEEQWLRKAACHFLSTHQPKVLGEVLTAVTATITERLETSLLSSTKSGLQATDQSRRELLDGAVREVETALSELREALAGGTEDETVSIDVNDLVRRATEISGMVWETARKAPAFRPRLALSTAREPVLALGSPGLLAVLVQVLDSLGRRAAIGGGIEIRTEHDYDHVLISIRQTGSDANAFDTGKAVRTHSTPPSAVERDTLVQAFLHEDTANLALSFVAARSFAKRHGGSVTCVLATVGDTQMVLRLRATSRSK